MVARIRIGSSIAPVKTISNPCHERKTEVTDRALRYRANACPPPGRRICQFCGDDSRVEVGHVNGHEEDNSPENKFWTCRSCNVRSANALRRAGLGRRTKQFNPETASGARNLGQWLTAVTAIKGESASMSVAAAVRMIRATPPEKRTEFANEIWRRRRARYGHTGRADSVPF